MSQGGNKWSKEPSRKEEESATAYFISFKPEIRGIK
jgi:hypothetical protein